MLRNGSEVATPHNRYRQYNPQTLRNLPKAFEFKPILKNGRYRSDGAAGLLL